jgi:hypothetical protein
MLSVIALVLLPSLFPTASRVLERGLSPIAQALLNKKVGDVVEVRVPAGMVKLRIDSITL